MSRYTTRKRTGGARTLAQTVNRITLAEEDSSTRIVFTFEKLVNADNVKEAAFSTSPGGESGTGASQVGPYQVRIQFTGDISSEVSATFNGNPALFEVPQTINITH